MPLNLSQKVNFKAVPEQVLSEFNFNGGLVADVNETKLAQNQTPNILNNIYNSTGSVSTRNGYLRYNNDPIGSSSDEANTGTSTGTLSMAAVGDWHAQTFQVGTAADMVQVNFYLAMNTSGEEQYVQAQLWSGSTGPSAHLLDAQILLVSGTSETTYNFRFRTHYPLAATTEYAVVLKPYVRGTTQTVNTVLVHHTGAAYASGSAYSSTDSGLNWSAVASTDLKFDVLTGGSTGSTGLIRYYTSTGIKQLIAKFGSSLYRGNDSTGVMTTITFASGVSLNSANFIDWTIVNDTLLVVDNNSEIKKYRGSTNSNYSTGTISVTNASATVTGSSTAWSTTTNAEVGEYIQLPDTKWYKITAIGSDTSLTIETTYQGSTASGQTYVISPWGEVQGDLNRSTAPSGLVVPLPGFIENHINRVWTLTGNTLNFSSLDTSITGEHFNDWDTSNNAGQIIVPSDNGDSGTGLYSLNGSLYVFQRKSIWKVYGSSPQNFELRNITREIGMINKNTLVEWNNTLIFLSDQGVYMFDGSNLKNITDGIVNSLIDTWANTTSPVATLWNNKYVIAYTSAAQSYNDEALFFDLTRNVWGKFDGLYVGEWSRWIGGTDNNEVYFASSAQGSIYKWDVDGHDDGYTIHSLYDTPSIGFNAGINDKSLKRVYVQQLSKGDWTMNLTMYTDINSITTSGSSINLSPGTSVLWDVAQWDVDSWSSENSLITTRIAEFQGIGKYFKFRFEQTGYSQGYEILALVVTGRQRRLR